jgi:hypothetical protein
LPSKFRGYGIYVKRHLRAFDKFVDLFGEIHEDVLTNLFMIALEHDAMIWCKIFLAGNIDLLHAFQLDLRDYWEESRP